MPTTKDPPGHQGSAPAYDAANGRRFGRDANRVKVAGGAHTHFPCAVSVLIMDLADKDFSSFGTSRPQNQNLGLMCLRLRLNEPGDQTEQVKPKGARLTNKQT